jgi:hypothetical protein
MNAIAILRTGSGKRPSDLMGAFLIMVLIAAIAAIAIPFHNQAKAPVIVIQSGSAHGDYAHGDEGPQARNCLQQHGTSHIFLEPDRVTYHFLCQGDSGDWFDVVAVREGDEYIEKTALEPQDGILKNIQEWLTKLVQQDGKGATSYEQIAPGTPVIFK